MARPAKTFSIELAGSRIEHASKVFTVVALHFVLNISDTLYGESGLGSSSLLFNRQSMCENMKNLFLQKQEPSRQLLIEQLKASCFYLEKIL